MFSCIWVFFFNINVTKVKIKQKQPSSLSSKPACVYKQKKGSHNVTFHKSVMSLLD